MCVNDQARAAVRGWERIVNAAWDDRAVATGQQPAITRALTPEEIAFARSVYGDQLDTSKIRLTEGGLNQSADTAVALPGVILFPPGALSKPGAEFDSWLIHELAHQWQYQRGYETVDLIPDAARGDYDYGKEPGLREALEQGKTLDQFNFEEQGDILRDYYMLKRDGKDTSAYDPFIHDLQDGMPIPFGYHVRKAILGF